MAEPLKNHFGKEVPQTIAAMIVAAHPQFPQKQFIKHTLNGYEALNLMARGRKIADALAEYLPSDFDAATDILLASLGTRPASQVGDGGMSSFLYLPHTLFIAAQGLDHFDTSMRAQYALTQRFTAEFSMRPFLEHHTDATLERLRSWANDPSEHVRRLVSESTRPRLPWASRLRCFQQDPRPVLALLELLKDDPALYVRRSVANNLNDIGKDNPEKLMATLRHWQRGATPERKWLINHALRSAVKRGEAPALDILGYAGKPLVAIHNTSIKPTRARIGGEVSVSFDVANTSKKPQRLLVDFRIHYVKANGATSPKVFKLKQVELAPKQSARLSKRVSLQEMTTRKHYPGRHKVDVLINGVVMPLGEFVIQA
jgi:3-methyladenine DNA glycosylase AlkC